MTLKAEAVRGVVEELAREYLGSPHLVVDADGDIPVQQGSTLYWIRVFDEDPVTVAVWANVVAGVPETVEVRRRIAELNTGVEGAEFYYENESIMLGLDLLADRLDGPALAEACELIGGLSDAYDDVLQREFGGDRAVDGTAG